MKIVYLAHSRIPSLSANSIHVMKMCGAFAALGHEVHLVLPDQDKESAGVADVFEHYGITHPFPITKVPMPHGKSGKKRLVAVDMAEVAHTAAPDLVYARHLRAALVATSMGLPVFYELHHLPEKAAGWIAAAKSVRQKVGAIKARYVDRKSKLATLHRAGALDEPGSVFERLIASPNFLRLIVITHALKQALLKLYPDLEGRIEVAPDGADLPPAQTSPAPLQGPAAELEVGYTGHLFPGKGMEILPGLAQLCPRTNFHIIGGRDEHLRYWKEVLAPERNVFFYGAVAPQAVPGYLQALDVCLLPNQPQLHVRSSGGTAGADIAPFTSPLKMFEYMAAGKAIVASDLDVLKEVLVHGQNCLLCRHDDPQEWANALSLLRDGAGLRRRLGSQALEDFCAHYEWRARARRIVRLFSECQKTAVR